MKSTFLRVFAILGIGLCAGFINGLLGAGGGILIVFGLRKLLGSTLSDGRAVYATAVAVMLPLSALTALQYFRRGSLAPDTLGWFILPAILGGALGGLLLRRLSPKLLARLFAAVVLVSGIMLVL